MTLTELIISISLLGVIILAATTFDTAIRQSFRHSDTQAQLLNELSPAMQQMTKFIMQGVGTVNLNNIGLEISTPNRGLKVRLDISNTPTNCADDRWIFYQYQANQIIYCTNTGSGCGIPPGWGCLPPGALEVIARKIFYNPATSPPVFDFIDSNGDGLSDNRDNLVSINLIACQDPTQALGICGSMRNPSVNLTTKISLRGKSIR